MHTAHTFQNTAQHLRQAARSGVRSLGKVASAMLLSVGLLSLAPPAHADELRTILGGGVGAAAGTILGQSVGGRSGAVIGGALGGAAGAAVTTHGHNQNGAVLGGALGGAAGAVVGQSVGGRNGAVMGAGMGGAAGASIGRSAGHDTYYQQADYRTEPNSQQDRPEGHVRRGPVAGEHGGD